MFRHISFRSDAAIRTALLGTLTAFAVTGNVQAASTSHVVVRGAGPSALATAHRSIAGRFAVRSSTTSLAAGSTIPVNTPYQLALDPQGNLYIANCGTNNILVYDSSFVQQTSRTLATPSCPIGVAVDPYGNVFAGSNGANEVVEYDRTGRLSASFTTGLNELTSIAVDPLDDVYAVNNAYSSLSIFQKSGALVQSYRVGQPSGSMTAVDVDGPNLITSQNTSNPNGFAILQSWDADSLVTGNITMHPNYYLSPGAFVIAVTKDTSGGTWIADSGKDMVIYKPNSSTTPQTFKALNYTPQGLAVDSLRGLIYVSDLTNSEIHVYNRKAQLVALIR